MKSVRIGEKQVHIFLPEGQPRLKIWVPMEKEEARALFEQTDGLAALFVPDGCDWNADLSPWPAKACFRGGGDFAGNAPSLLRWLKEAVVRAEAETPLAHQTPRAIMGYSLAGLFSLWAAAESGLFEGCASVSGSLWYDGFDRYLCGRAENFAGRAVYFSLGDKEAKTRNARLAPVLERTQQAQRLLAGAGAHTVFEFNPGNHFRDPAGRCLRAARWLTENING